MAEYKGLTIRIGGDTSSLNSALKSSTKAASTLQSQIRQITRAMRFDPGNLKNVDTRMRLTTNRAEALYSKIRFVKSSYDELGKSVVSVGGKSTNVKRLAESTENIALAATNAKERYNDMTATLASRYRELEARAKEAGKAMDLNALSRQGTEETFETQMAALKELGVITDEEIAKLREMRSVWHEAFDSSEAYEAAKQLDGMAVDMQRLESETRNATATVRELNTVSKYSADNWQEGTARVKAMDSALTDCTKQARAYEAALRQDPSNLSAAVGRLKALSSEYELAESKASELSRQVEAYKSRLSGVLAEQRNLPAYIQKTADDWQDVQNSLLKAKGEANALHQSLQRLKDAQAPVEEIRRLEAEVDKADARVDELSADARKLDAAFETSKECSELQRLEAELAETSARAKSVRERVDLTSLGGKSFLNASTIKSAGMTLYSTLTPAITMLGWRAVTAAQDIDSSYRDMRKTVEGTEQQFEALKQGAIDFSKTHVTSAAQLLEIESIGGELGVATDDLQKFAETVSNIEVATNYDTEGAATALGQLANITHMTADEYEGFSDALVRLGNNGASTETQIGDISTRIGSMANIVGMSVPDILAWSSTLASTGMQAEASGTAFSKTISLMETAVASAGGTMDTSFEAISAAVAKGGDELTIFANMSGSTAEQFAEDWATDPEAVFEGLQSGIANAKDSLQVIADVAHMSADDFAKAWEEDPTTALKNFIEGLNDIEESGGSADSVLGSIGITASRQKQAIEGLMQTIGLLDDNLEMSGDAWDGVSDKWGATGDAAREAEKKAEGFSGQLQILSNIANDAMASLAEGATPIISMFTDLAKSALDAFDTMDEGSKTTVVALLGVGAAIGPLLTMVSTFVTAKQNMTGFIRESTAMGKALAMLKQGFGNMDGAMGPAVPKMIAMKNAAKELGKSLLKNLAAAGIAAGIAIVIAAISDYIEKMQEFKAATENAGDTLSGVFSGISSNASSALGETAQSLDGLVKEFAQHNESIRKSAEETFGNAATIKDYGDALQEALSAYNEGDQSTESLARLKSALELYNGAAGESITLTDGEGSALQLMRDDAVLTTEEFDKLTQSIVAASKAQFFQDAYTQKYADQRKALDELTVAQGAADEAQRKYLENTNPNLVESLQFEYEKANDELERAKELYNSTTEAVDQYKEGVELLTEAQLEGAGAGTRWVADNDALQASIWQNGQSVTEFAHNLDDLGISYDDMQEHAEGINDLADTWDGSIGTMVAGLADMGHEIDLNTASVNGLNKTKINNKTYWVDDKGTILSENGKLVGLNAYRIGNKTYYVDDNGTVYDSEGRVEELTTALNRIPANTTAKVNTSVYGANSVFNLLSNLQSLIASPWNVKVNTTTTQSATGSVASSPYIPRHADGYIATRPTLTNHGWVGEAGAEAVLNWGTGGAVIPLTNKRYMEPIASAIAASMDMQGGAPVVNVTVNARTDADPNEIASITARKVKQVFMARGR